MNKNYKYLSDEHANYIKNLIKKVADKDKNYEIFGASTHKYRLNETVSLEWVREFEKKYQVELPEEYVFFITKVGNGGPDPFYGIRPLSLEEKEYKGCYENLSKPSIYDDNYLQYYKKCVAFSEKEYLEEGSLEDEFFEDEQSDDNTFLEKKEEKFNGKLDEVCDIENDNNIEDNEQAFYEEQNQIFPTLEDGVLHLNTHGSLLILNGSRKGEIAYMDYCALELDIPPCLINMTFLEWYQNFFEEVLAGYDTYQYGYYMLGNENELIEKYANADLETKSNIICTFFKFKSIHNKALSFLCHFDGIENVRRLKLILNFDVKKGLEFFDYFFDGDSEQIKIAVEACLSIPKGYRQSYYDKMLHFIYGDYGNFNDDLKRTALLFIRDTNTLSAGDLFAFLKNKENSESIRKTCMYAIGAARDKLKFVDTFVEILNTMDSEKILLEMTVILRNVQSEKIAWTYKKLIPKYQNSDNFLIVKNMEYYLKRLKDKEQYAFKSFKK